jgi:hypothetical protein
MAMDLKAITARVKRLDGLARGLAKEVVQFNEDTLTPLLYVERRGYLLALHRALGGVAEARLALVKARRRLEG